MSLSQGHDPSLHTDSTSSSQHSSAQDGPPYTWGQLAQKPVIIFAGVAWLVCFSLMIVAIGFGANTASHCVWLDGVCFDRPNL